MERIKIFRSWADTTGIRLICQQVSAHANTSKVRPPGISKTTPLSGPALNRTLRIGSMIDALPLAHWLCLVQNTMMRIPTTHFSGVNRLRKALLFAGALLGGTAQASDKPMQAGETGRVESIVDGDTLFLDSGLKVRLSATQAPKLPLGREGFKAWPLGTTSKKALSGLALGKKVRLYYGGLRRDRYDRALAQVWLLDGEGAQKTWLQEEMVRLGMSRVYTWPDTWQDSDRLYAAEQEARADRRGIWGHDFYAVRSPDPNNLAQDMDSFQLVEGIITSAAGVKDKVYLNFGADYRTDFTVLLNKDAQKRFKKLGLDPKTLEGARVRVRGWVEMQNGPMMILDHVERIEVLD